MIIMLMGGYGNGNWLPILWTLLVIAGLFQAGEWVFKYIKGRRKRKLQQFQRQFVRLDDRMHHFSDN